MIRRALSLVPITFALVTSAVAQERVWIDIEEDGALAASYWRSAAPRAGVLMLHGCMADRTALTPLAEAFAVAGYSVLTYDMFSHGESRTPRLAMNTREGHDAILSRVSADLTRAHQALRTRMGAPVSTPTVLVLSGCVVAWSSEFLAGTPEVVRLVLFSGVPNSAGRDELTTRPAPAVLGIAAAADARHADLMRQLIEASPAPDSEFIRLDAAGHGAAALLAAGGVDLVSRIVDWTGVHASDTIEQAGEPGSAAQPATTTEPPGTPVPRGHAFGPADRTKQCVDLPWSEAPMPLSGGRLESAVCEVTDSGHLIRTGQVDWSWALYRHVLVYEARTAMSPQQRALYPDTIRHDELVLFATSGEASAPGEPRPRPVWHDRSDARFEFIRPPRAASVAGAESAFLAHRRCLNGTGGCRDHPYRLDPDGTVSPLRDAYAATLHERLPEGWGTWKGIWLEPDGPRAEASVYLPGDANAAPSFRVTASLRVRGDTLVLDSMSLVPERDRFRWAVDPGEGRFGYVRASTSERDLNERYGAEAVRPADVYLAEGFCTPGTVLFPDTPWRAEVAWADSARTRPAFVRVDGSEGPWRTPLGVGPGTTVARLAELAGEPVTFGGFGWDYGGGLHWEEEGGRLRLRVMPDSASYLRLRELAASEDPRAEALFGDRYVRSDQPLVDELRIAVVEVRMDWSVPAIERYCE